MADRTSDCHSVSQLYLAYIHVGQDNRITELCPYLSSVHIVHEVSESDIPTVRVKIFQTMISLRQHAIDLQHQKFYFIYEKSVF